MEISECGAAEEMIIDFEINQSKLWFVLYFCEVFVKFL